MSEAEKKKLYSLLRHWFGMKKKRSKICKNYVYIFFMEILQTCECVTACVISIETSTFFFVFRTKENFLFRLSIKCSSSFICTVSITIECVHAVFIAACLMPTPFTSLYHEYEKCDWICISIFFSFSFVRLSHTLSLAELLDSI